MASIKHIERGIFSKLLCLSSGYVLNFSTASFDIFTTETIGIALCEKYRMSKWKSLEAYLMDKNTSNTDAGKLLSALLEVYTVDYADNLLDPNILATYKQAQNIIKNLLSSPDTISRQAKTIKESFDSDYITRQTEQMVASISTHPADAIGKAKELLESCLKTILSDNKVIVDKDWDLPRLQKEVCKILKLTPDNIPDTAKASQTIKTILGNLSAIAQGIAVLRNSYGSGHGKDAKYKGLGPRHASLAVGVATTAVIFLWDTHKEQQKRL